MLGKNRLKAKDVDPVLLHHYKEMRNERQLRDKILPLALAGKLLFFVGFIIMMFTDGVSSETKLNVFFGVIGTYVLVVYGLMIAWSPRGRRLKNALIVVGVLGLILAMAAGMVTLFYSVL